jgi:hypothetical protein
MNQLHSLKNFMISSLVFIAIGMSVASGCAADDPLSVTGRIDGVDVPATSSAAVIWLKDYDGNEAHKYGGGTATRDTFSIDLPELLPQESNVAPGLSVGWVALYQAGYDIPDGPVSQSVIDPIVGISARYAIIWKEYDGSGNAEYPWAADFSAGYTCAVCTQGVPDGYAPVSCSDLVVDVRDDGSLYEWCNWLSQPQ